jgi:hypothetical protein
VAPAGHWQSVGSHRRSPIRGARIEFRSGGRSSEALRDACSGHSGPRGTATRRRGGVLTTALDCSACRNAGRFGGFRIAGHEGRVEGGCQGLIVKVRVSVPSCGSTPYRLPSASWRIVHHISRRWHPTLMRLSARNRRSAHRSSRAARFAMQLTPTENRATISLITATFEGLLDYATSARVNTDRTPMFLGKFRIYGVPVEKSLARLGSTVRRGFDGHWMLCFGPKGCRDWSSSSASAVSGRDSESSTELPLSADCSARRLRRRPDRRREGSSR